MATPVAASLSPGLALGAIWWGMVGGGFPDWLDLRSEFRRGMRHRGFSHSAIAGALLTLAFWFAFGVIADTFSVHWLKPQAIRSWTIAFGLGYLSHILADACTRAGVRPLLPLSQRRVWLLPKLVRGKSSGGLDGATRMLASFVVVAAILSYVGIHLPW